MTSISRYSNSSFQERKFVKANLIVYKQMVEESLLVLTFKHFAKNEELKLDILHRICIRKIV